MGVVSRYERASAQANAEVQYRVLATTKTSTLEKELNEAAEAGFRFETVMGGAIRSKDLTHERRPECRRRSQTVH